MRTIKDVLRLKFDAELSHEKIASALRISKGVVAKYVGLAASRGLDWATAKDLSENELARRLLPGPVPRSDYVLPDLGWVHHELRRKGVTLTLLWEEYQASNAYQTDRLTYRYTQFCELYTQYRKQLKRSMRQVHRAGEKLFVDFAGPTIALTEGGRAHIFVATMGASNYSFSCATARETMVDWVESIIKALDFIGGVPALIVPDNPKALINNADRYEPRANDTVRDFARHYNTSVLPARPGCPQDKAKVEFGVQLVERWVLARLRHQRFATVAQVNQALAPLMQRLNDKPFQKMPGCRSSAFAQLDAPVLRALPAHRYEIARFKSAKVSIDYHVEVEAHRYSVPHALVGQVVDARITTAAVELLHHGQRVACHARSDRRGGFTTVSDHMPAAHKAHMQWTPQRLIDWGNSIGLSTGALITQLLATYKHPEHGYRSCLGLLSLARRYSKRRLEAACAIALSIGGYRYRDVRAILVNNRDLLAPQTCASNWVSPQHAHVRGPGYYQ